MPDSSLWSFYLATALSVGVTVVALGAALVINQRSRLRLQQQFSRQLLQAQDEERAWVAREVHDDALQQVAAVRHTFDRLGRGTSNIDVERQLSGLAETLRNVAHRLHPALLHKSGVATALTQLATEAATNLHLTVTAEIVPPTIEPSPAAGLAFYRVAQEALANVSRHARVETASLVFTEQPDGWMLRIIDLGRGCTRTDSTGGTTLGQLSMRERAAVVGGVLRVQSEPGQGTSVTLTVPRETK